MSSAYLKEVSQFPEPEGSPGRVFWITGLSGAGKTTLGRELWSRLRAAGRPVTFLDGDALRAAIAEDLGHSADDRRQSAMRNARLCQLLAEQGADVVCATISLFYEVQRWNRENLPGYREIYLRVPMEELRRRDSKGIYAGAQRGEAHNVVGIDLQAEVPEAPDLILDNYGSLDVDTAVDRILAVCAVRDPAVAAQPPRLVALKTKAESLEALTPLVRNGRVLPQVRFSVLDWRSDSAGVLAAVTAAPWGSDRVIVRSSAQGEDGAATSQAGRYDSVLGVVGRAAVAKAIDRVIDSFASDGTDDDQIFVQPMLDRVAMAGVGFSRSPSGGPYFIINYDDSSGLTDRVTAGAGDNLKSFLCLKSRPEGCPPSLAPVIALVRELETLLACDAIDVEFAVGDDGQLYLLQVRPLAVERPGPSVDDAKVDSALANVACKIALLSRPYPYLHGNRAIFGVMPDWNPAEIIGLRPRPLSLSLYRELITDAIWAYQRDNYGYKNLRSFPLMVSFHGLPYIDVRVSFNSFVPRDVD